MKPWTTPKQLMQEAVFDWLMSSAMFVTGWLSCRSIKCERCRYKTAHEGWSWVNAGFVHMIDGLKKDDMWVWQFGDNEEDSQDFEDFMARLLTAMRRGFFKGAKVSDRAEPLKDWCLH